MSLAEAPAWFDADPNHERGEFVLLVDAPPKPDAVAGESAFDLRRLLAALVAELPPARAARVAAAATGIAARRDLRAGARLEDPSSADRSALRYTRTMAATALVEDRAPASVAPAGWDARLELALRARGRRARCWRHAGTPVRCACRRRSIRKVPPSARWSSCIRPAGSSRGDSLRIDGRRRRAGARAAHDSRARPSGTGPRDAFARSDTVLRVRRRRARRMAAAGDHAVRRSARGDPTARRARRGKRASSAGT